MPRAEFVPDEERRFVAALLAGDDAVTSRFIERMGCVPRMLAAQNAKLGRPLDVHELQDVAQDTFVVILRQLPDYRPFAPIESWVHSICHFQLLAAARNKLRQRRRRRELVDDQPDPYEERVAEPSDTFDVSKIMSGLHGMDEVVVRLKHFEGLTFQEIADRLSISPNTAKSCHYRALARLRAKFRPAEAQRES